ncbi:MAG: alanine--glyoxylate aminotransferase family protein [Firmicutes bacterium]|nr:alanine--glyoxylate aminotransferase family protein [Bacillota bacterium]
MYGKKYLFSPGPVLVSQRVKNSLLHPDICHRGPDFMAMMDSIQEKLIRLFRADSEYVGLVVSGSGTAANEAVLSSILTEGEKILLITNGEFGERLDEIVEKHNIPKTILRYKWGGYPKVADVEEALKADPAIGLVAMVFHETSTGMINPVHEVGEVVARYGRNLMIDAVSAIGGEDVNVLRDNIDFCTGVANKAVGGLPGTSFICARRSVLEKRRAAARPRTVYLDIYKHLDFFDQMRQTPNTPNVSLFFALDAALEEILSEGLENRFARYRRCAEILRSGIKELGLKLLLSDEHTSNTVTSAFLPEGIEIDEFCELMEKKGIVIYPGKRHLKAENMFQVANMGTIDERLCRMFLIILRETLEELGYEIKEPEEQELRSIKVAAS